MTFGFVVLHRRPCSESAVVSPRPGSSLNVPLLLSLDEGAGGDQPFQNEVISYVEAKPVFGQHRRTQAVLGHGRPSLAYVVLYKDNGL